MTAQTEKNFVASWGASCENGMVGTQHDPALSRRHHAALVTLLIAASLVPIWAAKRFPSQNGPWFLLPTHMFVQYSNPKWDFSEHYIRNWHPIPHMLHDSLVGLVSTVLPLLVAEKIVLTAYVLLLPASVFYFLSVVAPAKEFLGYLSFLMIYSYPFFRGYHDFTLSIPLFFFGLAYWMRHREHLGKRQAVWLMVISTLVYLSHLFTFALLAGAIGWICLFERRSLSRAVGTSLLITLPGWLLFVDYLLLNAGSTWLDPSDTFWPPFLLTAERFLHFFFYTVSIPAFVIALLPWLWLGVFVVLRAVASGARVREVLRVAARRPLPKLVILLLVAYLICPYHALGWHKVNVRLIPFILVLLLGCLGQIPRTAEGKRIRLAFLATILTSVVCTSGLLTREVMRMDRLLAEYVSGCDAFEPNSRLLPIHLENPRFGRIRPLSRAYEYYHIEKGGVNGKSLPSLNTLSIMWYRSHPVERLFPKYDEESPERSLKRIAEAYDYVLVWGTDGELVGRLEQHRFTRVHKSGKLELYRNSAFTARDGTIRPPTQLTDTDTGRTGQAL